ncbi:MarR family winged helix-turn-helix transcriptional regulator [Compostimonas suwonensis]|uniref:DNA-binding MarR family transcriptional regulator n=1 Tax=Compostimonas suwonensis TaxID=1048394 RepID=A0A2M9BVN8_9MICO|nr:MarR family winged helix-turn-helix transcriptional regulator [Compostimonas suwonensis]PJJ62016.1 DNA-binding MarR family transcriptional regulator [Compostimonas suwonensis]
MSDDGVPGDSAGRAGPPEPSPTMLLLIQGRLVERLVESELAPLGLTIRQMGILGHLARSPGLSFTELAARAQITVQSMHTLAAAMTANGLIEAGPGVVRGRAASLSLTPLGHERLREAQQRIAELDERSFGSESSVLQRRLGALLSEIARQEGPYSGGRPAR